MRTSHRTAANLMLIFLASSVTLTASGFAGEVGQLRWAYTTGDGIGTSPAIGTDGTVYIGSYDSSLYALDGASGALKWKVTIDGGIASSPALGGDGTVYVGSGDGRLYALNGTSGAKQWSFGCWGVGSASLLAVDRDGMVYAGGAGPGFTTVTLYSVNGATGAQKWSVLISGVDNGPSPCSLVVGADGTIFLVAPWGGGYALDGATGAQKWSCSYLNNYAAYILALGGDGTLYVGASGRLIAMDEATGTQKWAADGGAGWFNSPCVGVDGTVYVGSSLFVHPYFFAIDGSTGAKKWELNVGVSLTPAIAADGTVYVGADRLYALDGATGTIKWSFDTGIGVSTSPNIGVDGTVYFAGGSKLYAVYGSAGLASSPWPKFQQNAQNTAYPLGAPRVLRQASRVVLKEGATGQIAGEVTGVPTPDVRWLFNGLPILGQSLSTLTISPVTRAAEGMYTMVASNSVGLVTSKPIIALVSNVDPESLVELKWVGGNAGAVAVTGCEQVRFPVWQPLSYYPASSQTQIYVEPSPTQPMFFYRLYSAQKLVISSAARVNGWWMTQPPGSHVRVEYVTSQVGWTNWQVLTTLTLPASPYQFIDEASMNDPARVYRTTLVP